MDGVQSELNEERPGFFGERWSFQFEDGRTCQAPRLRDSIFCRHHDPRPRGEEAEEEKPFEVDLAESLEMVAKLKAQFKRKFDELEVRRKLPAEEDLKAFASLMSVESKLAEEQRKSGAGPLTKLNDEVLPTFIQQLFQPVHNALARADFDNDITPREAAKRIWSAWRETFERFDIHPPVLNDKEFSWPWGWRRGSGWPSGKRMDEFLDYWSKNLVKCISSEVGPEVLEKVLASFEALQNEIAEGSPELEL